MCARVIKEAICVLAVTVVPVSTHEWLPNVFAGQSFAWYLSRVLTQLDRLFERHGLVSLVAHSQGGVLALILLGSQPYDGKLWISLDQLASHALSTSNHLQREMV